MIDAGQDILAQDIIAGNAHYAADAGSNDTYVISLPAAPASYTDGLTIRFKANTANTGASTLNVNSLGAIAIKRPDTTDTLTGDILANQIVEVTYRAGSFYMVSPVGDKTYKNGVTTYDMSTASGSQTIAHGLGKIPLKVRITAAWSNTTNNLSQSYGAYNGTTQSVVGHAFDVGNGYYATYNSSARTIELRKSGSVHQTGSVAVDATNITITWTKTGSPTGTADIMWEVVG